MDNLGLVAIITINYNHSRETIDCINSVLESTYNNYKIFLVDNGSEGEDYEILCSSLKDNRVKIVRQDKNVGYVGGVNIGLREAKKHSPDYFVIMNNDAIIDKNAIYELMTTAIKHNHDAIVSGKVYNMDEPDTLQYIGQWCKNKHTLNYPPYIKNAREKDIGQYDTEMELAMTDDMLWLLPSKIFNKVGYYSDDFFLYGEQNDYVFRALKHGFRLIYCPKAKLWHYHHLTTSGGDLKSLKVYYWQSYASLVLIFKYLSFINFITVISKKLIKSLVKYFYLAATGKNKNEDFQRSKVNLLAYKYFFKWVINRKPNTGFNPVS